MSPMCLLLLGAMSEAPHSAISENAAGGIGMIVLLILAAVAVAMFILSGSRSARFDYLETEIFETEQGVIGMVRELCEQYRETYIKRNIIGVCLCILGFIPLCVGAILNENSEMLLTITLCICFAIVGIGVFCLVQNGIVWASYEKLLQEGDYSKEKKAHSSTSSAIATVYWLVVAAVFLAYSFATNDWERSWIILVVAGILFCAVTVIANASGKRH